MQLDLGHLEVFNAFHWHSGGKSDPSAVHMDVLSAEVTELSYPSEFVVRLMHFPGS